MSRTLVRAASMLVAAAALGVLSGGCGDDGAGAVSGMDAGVDAGMGGGIVVSCCDCDACFRCTSPADCAGCPAYRLVCCPDLGFCDGTPVELECPLEYARDSGPPFDAGSFDERCGISDAGGPPPVDSGPGPRVDAAIECVGASSSDLAGVHIDFPAQRCTYSLAEAAAGLDIAYAITVDAPVTSVTDRPQDWGGCGTPGASGLIPLEELTGGPERYCLCDTGLCPGVEPVVDLVAGTFPATFRWMGRNWTGPSDTGMPLGAPFPPGDYTLRVSAVGTHAGAPFTVAGLFPIHLIP